MNLAGSADLSPHGADIYDTSALLRNHVFSTLAAGIKNPRKVCTNHLLPILVGDVGKELLL